MSSLFDIIRAVILAGLPRSPEDWKSGDLAICVNCATVPAAEKHLCPEHSTAFRAWRNARSAGAR